jgi:hypothetical protein
LQWAGSTLVQQWQQRGQPGISSPSLAAAAACRRRLRFACWALAGHRALPTLLLLPLQVLRRPACGLHVLSEQRQVSIRLFILALSIAAHCT